jgi:tetratricopeptide (TPR) repeat protein
LRDLQGAILLLEESIEYDPSNLGAYFKLLEAYACEEKHSERTRLLERMAGLFPKEKTVLLQAGRESIERKAYSNGIQYLERAHLLDPLDPEVLETLVRAYTNLARQYYEKRKVNKGRHSFDLARRHAIRDCTNFVRGLDFLQALQGVLELNFGDNEKGLGLMTAARGCTRSVTALLFFAHGNSRLYQRQRHSRFWGELKSAQVATAQSRKEIYLVFEHIRSLGQNLGWSAEIGFVRECLAPLGKAAFNREEALYFVPLLSLDSQFASLAKVIVSTALRHYPSDLRFRLYSVFGNSPTPGDLDIAEVEKIYDDAMRQGDTKTAAVARSAIETAQRFLEPMGEEDDDYEDFGFPHEEIERMRRSAAEMSDAEFEKFRKQSSKLIPLPLFDLLMGRARRKSSQGGPERRKRAGAQREQFDLFD